MKKIIFTILFVLSIVPSVFAVDALDAAKPANNENISTLGSYIRETRATVNEVIDNIPDIKNWIMATVAYTAVSGDRVLVDTSSTPCTITLPSSPVEGSFIYLGDAKSTWAINNVTLTAGTTKIAGVVSDYLLSFTTLVQVVYIDANYGWAVTQVARGDIGPPGSVGDQGPRGASGINWRGTWDTTYTYFQGDGVSYNNHPYVAVTENAGYVPDSNATKWTPVTQGATGAQGPPGATGLQGVQGPVGPQGPQGAQGNQGSAGSGVVWLGTWSSGTTYVQGNGVTNDGTLYIAIAETTNNEPPNATYWVAFSGAEGPEGPIGPQGVIGPQGPQGSIGPTGATGPTGAIGPTGPVGPAALAISGLRYDIAWQSVAGYVDGVTVTNGSLYTSLYNVSIAIDCATVGANGLDTGSLAASTWYYLYVIYNGSNTAGLASLSATTPTMPSGYTFKRLIGAGVTGVDGKFLYGQQNGNEFMYEAGNAFVSEVTVKQTWTLADASLFIPPLTQRGFFNFQMSYNGTTANVLAARKYGSTGVGVEILSTNANSTRGANSSWLTTDTSRRLQLNTTYAPTKLSVYVVGYRLPL